MIFLRGHSRRFKPVAATTLAELDQLVRDRLSAGRVAELKSGLRALMSSTKEDGMRIFAVGASSALANRLVPKLIDAGQQWSACANSSACAAPTNDVALAKLTKWRH